MSRGIQYSKEAVRIALNVLDQEGVSRWKSYRLKRQKYRNKGSDNVWHMDDNDKYRPFGFYVHGCIDGFGRKIIWLHNANTNKDPAVIAYYFLKVAEVINGTTTQKLEQILDQKILLSMVHISSFGETIMMNFLAVEAFNTVNQPTHRVLVVNI